MYKMYLSKPIKRIFCALLFCCFTFLSSNAQQALIDGEWILDYVVVDNNTYFAPPLFSQTPGCLPLDYFPGISFSVDSAGEYQAIAVLTFNNWFHLGGDPMIITSNSFTTVGTVTLGNCDCICDLEGLFLVTILAGDFMSRTFEYEITNTNGTDILTITTPEGDIAVFYDYSLSIEDTDLKPTFTLYPNPSSTELNIAVGKTNIQTINVFSITGKNVLSYSNLSNNSIDISELTNGIYFVEIISDEGNKTVQRFLKN